MVLFQAKTFGNIPVFDVLSRLIQGFLYHNIVSYEHDGFRHSSGKVFKSTNYKFIYKKDSNVFKFYFTSLLPQTEENFYNIVKTKGMNLHGIKFYDEKIVYRKRNWHSESIIFESYILMTTKDEKGNRRFIQPDSSLFLENLKTQSFQKYETFLQKEYLGEWNLELLDQHLNYTKISYNRQLYLTWGAKYKLSANIEMINLLLHTGIGSQTMKGFGMMKILKDNFINQENQENESNENSEDFMDD
jgi:CRISPR-associated endoribonuclease Cas6